MGLRQENSSGGGGKEEDGKERNTELNIHETETGKPVKAPV